MGDAGFAESAICLAEFGVCERGRGRGRAMLDDTEFFGGLLWCRDTANGSPPLLVDSGAGWEPLLATLVWGGDGVGLECWGSVVLSTVAGCETFLRGGGGGGASAGRVD